MIDRAVPLLRTVCMDLCGPLENPIREFCEDGSLQCFMEKMRVFHDLLREKHLYITGMELNLSYLPYDAFHTVLCHS